MNIKYSFIYHINKKRTIACWSHLLMTYSSEKIPWNFHTSLRSYLKNSCFGFHQAFQTPRNNKSTRPKRPRAFICFTVFGTPDKTLALVVDILLKTFVNHDRHIGSQIRHCVDNILCFYPIILKLDTKKKISSFSKMLCFLFLRFWRFSGKMTSRIWCQILALLIWDS